MNKQTLKEIREEATQWAQDQREKEAKDPGLKAMMDKVRHAEAVFFASQNSR